MFDPYFTLTFGAEPNLKYIVVFSTYSKIYRSTRSTQSDKGLTEVWFLTRGEKQGFINETVVFNTVDYASKRHQRLYCFF